MKCSNDDESYVEQICSPKFRSVEGMNYVLENGPWLVEGKPLFVQKWKAGLCWKECKNCNVRQRTEEERNEKVNYNKQDVSNDDVDSLKANGGWQSGNYGKGRGGMYGRGCLNGSGGGLSGGRG
ncbi:hypothetical protein Tco_1127024, partial [Tanacetum coccineum]